RISRRIVSCFGVAPTIFADTSAGSTLSTRTPLGRGGVFERQVVVTFGTVGLATWPSFAPGADWRAAPQPAASAASAATGTSADLTFSSRPYRGGGWTTPPKRRRVTSGGTWLDDGRWERWS